MNRGKVYAQFDAKLLYLLNTFLFEAGSAICGAAPTMDALIVGRAICGLGGAGMYTGVLTLLSVTTTDHERPTYIGFTGLTWGLGTVLGPIIGGALADSSATWRWAFCRNLSNLCEALILTRPQISISALEERLRLSGSFYYHALILDLAPLSSVASPKSITWALFSWLVLSYLASWQ